MLLLKTGVRIDLVQPQMVLAAAMVEMAYREIGVDCVITSGNDGNHTVGSYHYIGQALDFRTNTVPVGILPSLITRIKTNLGANYRVLLETDHLHVEFHPATVYASQPRSTRLVEVPANSKKCGQPTFKPVTGTEDNTD